MVEREKSLQQEEQRAMLDLARARQLGASKEVIDSLFGKWDQAAAEVADRIPDRLAQAQYLGWAFDFARRMTQE